MSFVQRIYHAMETSGFALDSTLSDAKYIYPFMYVVVHTAQISSRNYRGSFVLENFRSQTCIAGATFHATSEFLTLGPQDKPRDKKGQGPMPMMHDLQRVCHTANITIDKESHIGREFCSDLISI